MPWRLAVGRLRWLSRAAPRSGSPAGQRSGSCWWRTTNSPIDIPPVLASTAATAYRRRRWRPLSVNGGRESRVPNRPGAMRPDWRSLDLRSGRLGAGLLGQAQGPLADDVALDLAGAREDGSRPAGHEGRLPAAQLVLQARLARAQHPVGAEHPQGELAEAGVVLGPEQLAHAGLRAGLPLGGERSQQTDPLVTHQGHVGVGPGQVLTHQRVGGPPPLAGLVHQVPQLPLVAEVLRRRPAAALAPERC